MSASWDMASAPPAAHPMNLTDIDWSATEADQFFNTGDNNTMNNDNNGGGVAGKDANDMLLVDPRDIRRAETAPMVLTIVAADGTLCVGGLESEAAPGEEYRYTEEYHLLYYSKNPRDPRMLPPLNRRGQLPIHRSSNNTNTTNNNTAILHSSGAQKGTTNNAAIAEGTVSNSTSLGSGLNHHMEDSEHERKGSNSNIAAAVHSSEQQQQQPTIINPLQPTTTTTTTTSNNNNNNTTNGPKRLAEYVSSGRPEWDYAHIRSFISEFSRDQDGSRLVQRLLEKHDNIAPIFDEIMADFEGIVTDVFGNYVLQKLFDEAAKSAASASATEVDADQNSAAAAAILSKLTAIVRGNFKRYSTQTYSCRVIQKALENMRPTDRNEIIHEFDDCVVECVLDQNANHVVQKIIEVCPQECQFIIDAFLPRLSDLACHAYGCRVLQRAFERCHDVPEVNIIPLLEAVLAHVSEFNIHQYGNYVVQHGMLNSPEPLRKKFIEKLMPQVYALSCSKFGSNVAEKVVSTANDAERDAIIEILTKPLGDSQGGNYLVHMMQDTYANYVVQRFLECSSTAQRAAIGEHVKPHVDSANQTVYGRFLLRKMELMGVLSREYLFEHGIDVTAPEYGGVNGNMHPNGGSGNRKRNNNNNNNSGKHSRNNNNNNNNMNNNNANTNNNNNNNNSSNRMGRQNVHSAMPPPAMPAPPTLHYSPQQQPFNLVPVYGSYSTAVYSPAGYAQPQQQQPQPQHQQPTAQAPQGVYYNSAYAQAPAPGPSTEYHYAQPQYALSAAPAPTAPPQGYMQPQPTMMGFSGGYTMGPAAPAGGYGQINVTVHGGGQRRGKRNDYGL